MSVNFGLSVYWSFENCERSLRHKLTIWVFRKKDIRISYHAQYIAEKYGSCVKVLRRWLGDRCLYGFMNNSKNGQSSRTFAWDSLKVCNAHLLFVENMCSTFYWDDLKVMEWTWDTDINRHVTSFTRASIFNTFQDTEKHSLDGSYFLLPRKRKNLYDAAWKWKTIDCAFNIVDLPSEGLKLDGCNGRKRYSHF